MAPVNEFGQPIGPDVPGWTARPFPPRTSMHGRLCRLEPLEVEKHAKDLFAADQLDDGRGWTYMLSGPFTNFDDYRKWCELAATSTDPQHFAIVDLSTNKPIGTASYLRIDPKNGVVEVGHIKYSPKLQRTPIATETMFLMMQRAFDELGYRRYEWKCDNLNEPSKRAAKRLGFQFEGIFRQAIVYKNRSRDTAWFSIVDSEWPKLRAAYEKWLSPENFASDGSQKQKLAALIEVAR